MLTPAEILRFAERKYPEYLKSLISGDPIFPMRIRFGLPSTTDDFAKLQTDVTALSNQNFGYTIEWEVRNTRRYGQQKLPSQVRFDTAEQFVAALKKSAEVEKFRKNVASTLAQIPPAKEWMISYVKWIVEFGDIWDGILAVCEYFLKHPKPNLYIRELPIPVHTKFIQENSRLLSSLLQAILPPESVNEGDTFEGKFGLKPLEPLVRFRVLDGALMERLDIRQSELGLPISRFRLLPAKGLRVIITENLMNFECLPDSPNSLAIFGQGNAAELLLRIDWLGHCDVRYWGDIDEHGFHILARMRARFPNIRSMLMDIATLEKHKGLSGTGVTAGKPPVNLTDGERLAFEFVQSNGLRLEQEKIPQGSVLKQT